jgi:Flp pilus assembly protein TadG
VNFPASNASARLRNLRDESGAAAVEFAMVATAFLVILFGIIELGFGIFCGTDAQHAIERATRVYIVNPDATDQQFKDSVAKSLMSIPIDSISINITKVAVSGAPMAQIVWSYSYAYSIPFLPTETMKFGSQVLAPLRPSQ